MRLNFSTFLADPIKLLSAKASKRFDLSADFPFVLAKKMLYPSEHHLSSSPSGGRLIRSNLMTHTQGFASQP